MVGTPETVEKLVGWLERCGAGVPAKESKQPNLFPRFPGFAVGGPFDSTLSVDDRVAIELPRGEIGKVIARGGGPGAVQDAVELFIAGLLRACENGPVDVLVCAPPHDLLSSLEDGDTRIDPLEAGLDEASDEQPAEKNQRRPAFHDLLKARGMSLAVPIQMIRQETYDESVRRVRKSGKAGASKPMQDPATRAWNFFTALYYKAGATPWRLPRSAADLTTCFLGVSFYRSPDEARVMASVAQVFNERGEGMIVRGGLALLGKQDRQPHLDEKDSASLLKGALAAYRDEHHTSPARVVIHKTSGFSEAELDGFRRTAAEDRISDLDLVSVRRSSVRLFRTGSYPPLRGTWVELDPRTALLYLRGSVDFFATYPGLYVPRALEYSCVETRSTPRALAEEMLALSKLNWNNTQFDGGEPITVRAARRVGDILKNIPEGAPMKARFRFFM